MAIVETEMTYNYRFHRYVLTIDTVRKYTGYDMVKLTGSRVKAENKLDEFSRQVYLYMYMGKPPKTKQVLEFRIFDEEDSRDAIMWAMLEQVKYAVTDSGNLLGDKSGISERTGNVIEDGVLDERTVSPLVKQTLKDYELMDQRYAYSIDEDDYRDGY